MKPTNRPILFLDSGIGGIPYCMDFLKHNPQETVYYLADREHFPYGPRSKEDIASLLIGLTEKFLKIAEPKIIVVACNTASISALEPLRQNFPQLAFVGTIPAIKPAAQACQGAKIGLLGTERTINDIRSLNLEDDRFEIFGIAAPELVDFVEHEFDKADKKDKAEIVKKYITPFRAEGINTLVLGCTHFLYLIDEFRREAAPCIKIFDSVDGITKRIESLLNENNSELRAMQKPVQNDSRFFLTGRQKPDPIWQNRAKTLGFSIYLLDEYE